MKNLVVLSLIVLFEVVGNTFLSFGMRSLGPIHLTQTASLLAAGPKVATNPWVLLGVSFLIGYFIVFLVALSRLDLSYVLPMTAVSYVLTAFFATGFLGESVSLPRWLGTLAISIGVVLVNLSERTTP